MKSVPKEFFPIPEKLPGPRGVNWYVNAPAIRELYSIPDTKDAHTVQMRFESCVVTEDDAIRTLIGIAKHVGAKRIFEIGTNVGATATNLALSGFEVSTLDLPRLLQPFGDSWNEGSTNLCGDAPGFLCRLYGAPVNQYLGDSTKFPSNGFSGKFDLVFVDGAHDYEHVVSDTNLAGHLIRPGGTIVWDDTQFEDVMRAIENIEGVTLVEGVDLAYWTSPA